MPDNLVFVFADQMRGQDMQCAGNDQIQTPHLDEMAAEGVRFTNAVSTCPVCTPYRAALLTGRYPLSNGMCMNDVRLPVGETSIAEVMSEAGYETGYVGKWHLDGKYRGGFTPPGPRRQGFEYWAAADCCHQYMNSYYYRDDPELIRIDGYDADHFTDLAIEYMRAKAEDPFCLFLSWGPPHNPYHEMPEEYEIYDPQDMELRDNVAEEDRELAAEQYAGYYAHITALDRNIGRMRGALEELGIAEDTLLIFTSDHGDMLRSHGWRGKQMPHEESILVPFIAVQPGTVPEDTVSDVLLNVPDLMPTLLSQLGIEIPDTVEGQDLSGALRGEQIDEPTSAFLANPTPFMPEPYKIPEWRAVRTKRYTYARTLEGPWLLYDNENDPFQMDNLIGQESAMEVQEDLDAELDGWLEKQGDEFLPLDAYVEQFGFELMPSGHPVHYGEPGLHSPDNEAGERG